MSQHPVFKTHVLDSEKRRVLGIYNYIPKNLEYYDGFKDLFEVVFYLRKPFTAESNGTELLSIEMARGKKLSLWQKLRQSIVKNKNKPSLKLYAHWARAMFSRVRSYVGSVEFTHCTMN